MALNPSLGMAGFMHKPLDGSCRQIRLFKITSNDNGRVHGRLEHFYLEDAPSYRALSYTWGLLTDMEEIIVNAATFMVRRNLLNFLSSYQQQHMGEYLWVDQLCIDQENNRERNHQVQMMTQIYQQAFEVFLWLDTDSKPLSTAECKGTCDGDKHYDCQIWKGIITNRYWSRVWILQEVYNARSIRIHYGDISLSWDDLSASLHRAVNDERVDASTHKQITYGHVCQQLQWLWYARGVSGGDNVDLEDILWSTQSSQCHNLKDQIYGLQGLLPASQQINVDYAKSIKEVFIDTAVMLLTEAKGYSELTTNLRTARILARSMCIDVKPSDTDPTIDTFFGQLTYDFQDFDHSSEGIMAFRTRLDAQLYEESPPLATDILQIMV